MTMPFTSKTRRQRWRGRCLQVVATTAILVTVCAAAPRYRILYSFTGMPDGGGAFSGVTFDAKGNLYGTTSGGGLYGDGTVYKLKRQPDGQWTEKLIHSFSFTGPEGINPVDGVTFDGSGNLYGTTQLGGEYYHGAVFRMVHSPAGWALEVLYSFCSQPNCVDSGSPWGTLTLDKAGNLYGTGSNVYELSPGLDGWTETVLHDFCQQCRDGWRPFSGVVLDAKGNLYGTTLEGGLYGGGVVFKLRHMPDGAWKERILHDFSSFPDDGWEPGFARLTFDSSGDLYGTTDAGGGHWCGETTCGTVFKLTRQPNGHWKETILHRFKRISSGYGPRSGVVFDQQGNLYGTADGGTTQCACGVIYKLSPNPDGTWSYTVLHNFSGYDGAGPDELILDDQGNLYGAAVTGGPGGYGVVFKLTP